MQRCVPRALSFVVRERAETDSPEAEGRAQELVTHWPGMSNGRACHLNRLEGSADVELEACVAELLEKPMVMRPSRHMLGGNYPSDETVHRS